MCTVETQANCIAHWCCSLVVSNNPDNDNLVPRRAIVCLRLGY